MSDPTSIFHHLTKKDKEEIEYILSYVNEVSGTVNAAFNDSKVDPIYFIYILQNQIIKMIDFVPKDKQEELLFILQQKIEEKSLETK